MTRFTRTCLRHLRFELGRPTRVVSICFESDRALLTKWTVEELPKTARFREKDVLFVDIMAKAEVHAMRLSRRKSYIVHCEITCRM